MNNGEKIRKFGKKIREMKVDWWLGGDKWVLVIHSGLPIPICHILVPNPLSFHEFFHRFLQDQWKFVIMLAISKNEYNEIFLVIFKHCDTFQNFEFLRQKWAKWTFENPKIYFFLKMNAAML